MKIVALLARVLLGLIFLVFGLNGFLHFIPMPPMPPSPAATFSMLLISTHYVYVVAALQVLGGALLLINKFVPLALTLLGPVIVNIFLFHLLMAPQGLPMAIVVVVLWAVQFWFHKKAFAGILASVS
jgi:putative oxidoreductase